MKILIATDGSEFSRKAIEHACELGAEQWTDPAFRIVSVYEEQIPTAAEPFALSADYYRELDRVAKERAEKDAEDGVAMVKARFPDSSVVGAVELGKPVEVIVETADSWKADLIVLGSHGRGFWGRLGLGSVSDAVVHHASCSVLVVKSPTS